MNNLLEDSEFRKLILRIILNKIIGGEYYHTDVDPNKLYQLHRSVRHEYLRPTELSGHNWGYMTIGEMDAGHEDK